MNKLRYVARFIKYIAIIVGYLVKTIFVFLPRIIRKFINFIGKRLRFSITFKTTVTYTLMFSFILFILCTALICASIFFLFYESNQSLAKNTLYIQELVQDSQVLPQNQLDKYASCENISVSLFDQDNNLIYASQQIKPKTWQKINFNYPLIKLTPNISLDENLHYESQVKLANGMSKIEVSKDLIEERYYIGSLIVASAAFIILAIIIMIIIGSRTTRGMLRPIDQMTRTARSISFGDLNTRLDVIDSHDELKEMAETFNEMLERIQSSVEQQNTFVSNASHELRTPIAVIQGYANLLQRWGKEERSVLDESLAAIKNESDYMKELVEKLLFLASADKQAQKLTMIPFSLSELLDEVLKETKMIDSEHEFSTDISDNITVNGDRGLIKQALRIVIDNSLKYTPAGGLIKVSTCTGKQHTIITIADNGIGIAAEDLPYIFDRFYKADKSRNREAGGAGLGLSIAKWIVEQHNGNINAASVPNQGSTINIILPVVSN